MAKLNDSIEQQVQESLSYINEELDDFSAFMSHGLLTIAQFALLIPSLVHEGKIDATTVFEHYFCLIMHDISKHHIDPRHPVTLIKYSEYWRLLKEGMEEMFGDEGEEFPLPTAAWFIDLDEADLGLKKQGISLNLEELKASLKAANEQGKKTVPYIKVEAVRGITKQEVIDAFEGMHFNRNQWSRSLADVPEWLERARVMKGNKTTSAIWNPVQIAVELSNRGTSIKKLDAVFVNLKDWIEEWQAAREYLSN